MTRAQRWIAGITAALLLFTLTVLPFVEPAEASLGRHDTTSTTR